MIRKCVLIIIIFTVSIAGLLKWEDNRQRDRVALQAKTAAARAIGLQSAPPGAGHEKNGSERESRRKELAF